MNKKTILIVDDDLAICTVLKTVFQLMKCEVVSARDGHEAFVIVSKGSIDLVIMDIRMPVMDGEESIIKIREINPSIPIIIVTVIDEKEIAPFMQKYDVDIYYRKPFELRTLKNKVQELLFATKASPLTKKRDILLKSAFGLRDKTGSIYAKWKWRALVIGGLVAAGFIFYSKTMKMIKPSEDHSIYRLPYNYPSSITWDGKHLWILDWNSQIINKHQIGADVITEKYFPQDSLPCTSIVYGGGFIWVANQDGIIRKHDPGNFTVVQEIKNPNGIASMIAWDGAHLWSLNDKDMKIYKHKDNMDLDVELIYQCPTRNPAGMVWVGNELWIGDGDEFKILCFEYRDKLLTLKESISLGDFWSHLNKISGLTTDGENIWAITDGNGRLFRRALKTLRNSK